MCYSMQLLEPILFETVGGSVEFMAYGASSVKDFLGNKSSVRPTTASGITALRIMSYYFNNRALIYFGNVDIYRVASKRYRVEDMTGKFICSHTPFWFPPGVKTPRDIQEGRQYTVIVSYNRNDESKFLMRVNKFPPEEDRNLDDVVTAEPAFA